MGLEPDDQFESCLCLQLSKQLILLLCLICIIGIEQLLPLLRVVEHLEPCLVLAIMRERRVEANELYEGMGRITV